MIMSVKANEVYETISGRRFVVVGVAYDQQTKQKVVIFHRQRRRDEWFTIPLNRWNQSQLRYVGNLVIK